MTPFEQAEALFDQAEREIRAARQASLSCSEIEARQHQQRAAECRRQANLLLDEALFSGYRVAG